MAVYFDAAATTFLDPEVFLYQQKILQESLGNPSAIHQGGQRSAYLLEESRNQLAKLFKISSSRILFTSCATESNNLIIQGFSQKHPLCHFKASLWEHPSVRETVLQMPSFSFEKEYSKPLPHEFFLHTGGNSDTGFFDPHLSLLEHKMHQDWAQGMVSRPTPQNFSCGLTLSSHKIYGPQGFGVLILPENQEISPLMYGGSQEQNLRPGTPAVSLIASGAFALQKWHEEKNNMISKWLEFQNQLLNLSEKIPHTLHMKNLFKEGSLLPHITCLFFEELDATSLLMLLDQEGFLCSSGTACHVGKSFQNQLFESILPSSFQKGALRISFHKNQTQEEIDLLCQKLPSCIEKARKLYKKGYL